MPPDNFRDRKTVAFTNPDLPSITHRRKNIGVVVTCIAPKLEPCPSTINHFNAQKSQTPRKTSCQTRLTHFQQFPGRKNCKSTPPLKHTQCISRYDNVHRRFRTPSSHQIARTESLHHIHRLDNPIHIFTPLASKAQFTQAVLSAVAYSKYVRGTGVKWVSCNTCL